MSTIRVDNFGPSAGGTTYSARGIAKAWVNFDGTGTIAARDSENVSSLTDNGTGAYTVNFSNAMGDTNYATTGSAWYTGVSSATINIAAPPSSASSKPLNAANLSGTAIDVNHIVGLFAGDLA